MAWRQFLMMLKIIQNQILRKWKVLDDIPWDFCGIYIYVLNHLINLSKRDPTLSQIIGPYKRCRERLNMYPMDRHKIFEFLEIMKPKFGDEFGDYPGNASFEPHVMMTSGK